MTVTPTPVTQGNKTPARQTYLSPQKKDPKYKKEFENLTIIIIIYLLRKNANWIYFDVVEMSKSLYDIVNVQALTFIKTDMLRMS